VSASLQASAAFVALASERERERRKMEEDHSGDLVQEALRLIQTVDVLAAVERISRDDDPIAVMKSYNSLLNQVYWKMKDLPVAVTLALSGINYGLTFAYGRGGAEIRYDLRSLAKSLAYNLAAFTWPGWDEPGIEIGPAAVAIGLDSAKLNLRLALELEKGDVPLARGHWMLGAQWLANRNCEKATEHFLEAARYASLADHPAEVELAHGFIALTRRIVSPDETAPLTDFAVFRSRLENLPEGPDYLQQILVAARVFGVPFDD
jgi:hypothetical protein